MNIKARIRRLFFPQRRDRYNLNTQKRPEWFARAEAAVDLVMSALPDGGSVADIGCGDQKVRHLLQKRGSAYAYSGFDIKPQSREVIQLDLGREPVPSRYDAIVILGVLEYIDDFTAALRKLADGCGHLVVSHVNPDDVDYNPERIRQMNWKTVLKKADFEIALAGAGFSIIERRILADTTRIWLCRSAASVSAS